MTNSLPNLLPLMPLLPLLLAACALILLEAFSEGSERGYLAAVSAIGFLTAILLTLMSLGSPSQTLLEGALVIDDFGRASTVVMMASGLIATLISPAYVSQSGSEHGEYYALMLFAVLGMSIMSFANDLFAMFLGLETMSIAVYGLTALRPKNSRSAEAALKYLLMGAFATGFLLFGMALIYGAAGTASFPGIAAAVQTEVKGILAVGIVLLLIGFAFKIAAVPFHMWAPDVYEGAPTPISGFMAVGVKAAAFLTLLRIVISVLSGAGADAMWVPFLWLLAVVSIVLGNVLALVQTSIKRMLAYSSISHAGYALIGVVAAAKGQMSAGPALLFYLTVYTFMTLGAFGVLAYLEAPNGDPSRERYDAYAGTSQRHPALALAMVIFMIALAGLPPTGGFFGKMYLFTAAIRAGELNLALVGILGSLISVYYYLRVLVAFYVRPDEEAARRQPKRSLSLGLALAVAAFFVLQLGILPNAWLDVTQSALRSLLF